MSGKIELGDKVRDRISGFMGIAVGCTEWMYGCTRFVVSSQELHNGNLVDNQSFDVQQLEIVEKRALEKQALKTEEEPVQIEAEFKKEKAGRGGPQDDPTSSRPGW